MRLGMVGMGRMGANMSSRLVRAGHEIVVFDRHPEKVRPLVEAGAIGTGSLGELARALEPPRAIWLMVQAAGVDATIEALLPNLARGDVLIDGGNSHYREDIPRAKALANAGIRYVDVGTSGGVWGKERGYCLIISAMRFEFGGHVERRS